MRAHSPSIPRPVRSPVRGAPVPPLCENRGKQREGGGVPARSPHSRKQGAKGWAYLSRAPFARKRAQGMSLFRAYREAVCPRAPPSVRMGKGRAGGGHCGWGKGAANDGDSMPSCAPPLPRGHVGTNGEGRGRGAAGIVCPCANEGGGQGALPIRLPIRAQAEARAQRGGSGPTWSPFASCLHVNEGRGGKRGVLTFPAPPLCVNGRRAARKRERGGGSPKREEGVNGGPPFLRPCLLCAKTGVGGQKARSHSHANRGGAQGGQGGRPGPRLCILFNVNRGRRRKGAGKGGGPREEAEGGHWEGLCDVRRRGEVHPPRGQQGTWKGGHKGRGW
ncbi:hypothetical protein EDB85DRAFT_1897797 [Lactarius pseudohatsudake]|nr:hypothetical protein EDB85DRAFT_1897797 [Lactarius pseudohatsudake]